MRLTPTTQKLLGVVTAEVAQAGESLRDEREWLDAAVDFDEVAPGGKAVGDDGASWCSWAIVKVGASAGRGGFAFARLMLLYNN